MKLVPRILVPLALIAIAHSTFAQGFVPLTPITDLFGGGGAPRSLGDFLNTIFQLGIGIAAFLAVIMIMWGGFQYMTTEFLGKKAEGKERIKGAIYGLLLILGTYIILYTINPAIVRFDLFGGAAGLPGQNQVQVINGVPTRTDSQAACELLEDDGSYQGRRYYVATLDECQRTCAGRCTTVTADTLRSQTTQNAAQGSSQNPYLNSPYPLDPLYQQAQQQNQQFFQNANQTVCTQVVVTPANPEYSIEESRAVQTITYATSDECSMKCSIPSPSTWSCTSGGF